jgi:cobalt/nickel transport system ATP-binding protein
MSCSVKIQGVSFSSKNQLLCKNINLQISHKEKVGIIGPNGCGKTTLLNIIAGIDSKDCGSLEIFHKKITSKEDYRAIRPMIGYLFQNSDNQFLAPRVLDDVVFSLRSAGVQEDEAIQKGMMILNELQISHLKDKIVYHLSGGEKKLVALAGVLVMEPKLLLLDEPTNGLDYSMQLRLVEILKEVDKSIVIVSHDTDFIDQVVDKNYKITPNGLVAIKNP